MQEDELQPTPGSDTPDEPPPAVGIALAKGATSTPAAIPEHVKRGARSAKKPAEEPQGFTRDKDTPVTLEEYTKMMEDRPIKFGPKTSGFQRDIGEKNGYPCYHCLHFYSAPAANKSTCEIVRVSDTEDEVKANDHCRLWTKDGENIPLLGVSAKAKTAG